MTTLDVLRTMRESLTVLLQMQPEELRALLAEGYGENSPANYRQMPPAQWALADLHLLAEGATKLAHDLDPALAEGSRAGNPPSGAPNTSQQ